MASYEDIVRRFDNEGREFTHLTTYKIVKNFLERLPPHLKEHFEFFSDGAILKSVDSYLEQNGHRIKKAEDILKLLEEVENGMNFLKTHYEEVVDFKEFTRKKTEKEKEKKEQKIRETSQYDTSNIEEFKKTMYEKYKIKEDKNPYIKEAFRKIAWGKLHGEGGVSAIGLMMLGLYINPQRKRSFSKRLSELGEWFKPNNKKRVKKIFRIKP